MTAYRLNYTLWNMDTNESQLIKNDVVQFEGPKNHNDIFSGLELRWGLIRGDNIRLGDCSIELLSI